MSSSVNRSNLQYETFHRCKSETGVFLILRNVLTFEGLLNQ